MILLHLLLMKLYVTVRVGSCVRSSVHCISLPLRFTYTQFHDNARFRRAHCRVALKVAVAQPQYRLALIDKGQSACPQRICIITMHPCVYFP